MKPAITCAVAILSLFISLHSELLSAEEPSTAAPSTVVPSLVAPSPAAPSPADSTPAASTVASKIPGLSEVGAGSLLELPKAQHWNAAEYGVVADGKTDVTAALQALLDLANRAGGGVVELATGRYCVKGTLRIPEGVTLQGTYRMSPTVNHKDQDLHGTVLLAYAGKNQPNGPAFITLAGNNTVLAGVVIIYPEWDPKVLPPIPYPPCIESCDTNNVGVLDCCLLNPYEGIKMVRNQRHLLRNITGYPIWRGLFVDQCYDIGHVENFHYWPFGLSYRPDDPYCEWINKNGVAFEFARADWEYVFNTFCFGYGVGYKFSAYQHGGSNGNFLGIGADCCRRAVLVEQTQEAGLLITNGEFVGRWTSQDSICLEIQPENSGKVSLSNCSFWGPIVNCVLAKAEKGQFTANACHFQNWDNAGTNAAAIEIRAGKAIVSNSTFTHTGTALEVLPEAKSVIATGNQATGGFVVEGAQLPQVVLSANEPTAMLKMTDEEKLHYQINVGTEQDLSFLRHWHYIEQNEDTTMRWSRRKSLIRLPVVANRAYRVTLHLVHNPFNEAEPQTAGIWLGDQQLGTLAHADNELTVEIPPQEKELVTLELRSPGWVPAEMNPTSTDPRVLGACVRQINVDVK